MTKEEHQAPNGEYNYTDYSSKMDNLIFRYDKDYYPLDDELPDPQIDPIIPGKKVALQKVGISPVDLPITVMRRDGASQTLQAQASLYCSLDDPTAKGLNLSRVYILMHNTIKDHLTNDGIRNALQEMANKQGANNAYCKLRFRYPWTQLALRTREPLNDWDIDEGNYETLENGERISLRKMEGHIAYDVTLEGRFRCRTDRSTKDAWAGHSSVYEEKLEKEFRFFLTIDYTYSSTCPCSFELAYSATEKREAAANAHSQRSVMTTTVEYDPENVVWIEDLVELHRINIPTEVQVVVKRRDEQAFAELNGSNLLFSEDAVRIVAGELDVWYDEGKIFDYTISTKHEESLHPWNAIAVMWKHADLAIKG